MVQSSMKTMYMVVGQDERIEGINFNMGLYVVQMTLNMIPMLRKDTDTKAKTA